MDSVDLSYLSSSLFKTSSGSDARSKAGIARWAKTTKEQRREHYLKSFGTPESLAKVVEAGKRAWSNYTPAQKQARLNNEILSQKKVDSWKRTYESMTSKEKSEWSEVHLMGRRHSKSHPEEELERYLCSRFPGEWKYNGNGPDVVKFGTGYGRKVPDFIHTTKSEIIEVFGYRWHDESDASSRIQYFKDQGYKCTIIWEDLCGLDSWSELDKIFGVSS